MKRIFASSLALVACLSVAAAEFTTTLGPVTLHAGKGTGKALATVPDLQACAASAPAGESVCKVPVIKTAAPPVITPPAPPVVVPPVVVTPPAPTGPVFYVDASAATDSGSGTAAAPKQCLASAATLLPVSGGGTLIVKPGTYSRACDALTGQGKGAGGKYNVIRAEVDGTVRITQPLVLYGKTTDWYLQFEGLFWDTAAEKSIVGGYVKILRSAFKGGPARDNTNTFGLGTNDVTPGAHHILIEDTQFFGPGGRYNLLVYNSDKIVLRRVVARHEGGWGDTKRDPEAAIAIYNSVDVLTQNLLIVDSRGDSYFESALYHPSNSRSSANIRNVGAMILASAGNGVCWEDGATVTGMTLEHSAIVNAKGVGACTNSGSKQVDLVHVTINGTGSHGVANWGKGAVTVTDSVLTGIKGEQIKGAVSLANVAASVPKAASASAPGASILLRLGKSGAGWGEDAFDQPTADALWPWPGEAGIKQRMCTDAGITTGMCAASSVSSYVWGLLGGDPPAGVK